MNPSRLVLVVVVAVLVAGRASGPAPSGEGARYFADPASAVDQIADMLREKDWAHLAEYYDLSDSPIARANLVSGDFFHTDERPASAHPAGFWHYNHPFAPAFTHRSCRELETPVQIGPVNARARQLYAWTMKLRTSIQPSRIWRATNPVGGRFSSSG